MIQATTAALKEATVAVIYCDGGCEPNPGRGGWAAVLEVGKQVYELSGAEIRTTNNRMEMTAALMGLSVLPSTCAVTVVADSQYVVKGMTVWAVGRKRKMRNGKKPVPNVDLWQKLDAITNGRDVTWQWVRGHNGHVRNERADALASAAMRAVQT